MTDLFGDSPIPEDALDRLEDVEIRKAWPRALVSMVEVVEAEYRRADIDPDQARQLAFRALRALAGYHGGRMFYLPKGDGLERALRDREIWERFTGRNVHQLVERYGLTEVQIYKILREQRSLETRRRQHSLFPDD